jgi:serine/threonine-protein kinase
VKVLREELAATVSAERFSAEIRVSLQLQHPSIVPVLESGEVNGVPYYVMPFIEGESLRARLARQERLPLAEALWITEDLARALDFAHRRYVVHRDIKPANVMLHHGQALLLDFGIALALDGADHDRRTSPGMTLGTVEYMSPEQAAGERQIDGRSDIYSLACVAYEMLGGRPPFTGAPTTVMNRHVTAEPRALSALCPGIPAGVSCALARALAKGPDSRYATANEFLAALRSASQDEAIAVAAIAVLPFLHLRPAPIVDAYSDSVTEKVIHALRKLACVQVAPRNAMAGVGGGSGTGAATHQNVHVPGLGRQFRARTLLFGSVRETVDCVQLSATLIDGERGNRLGSVRLVGRRREEHDVEYELASGLARALGASLESLGPGHSRDARQLA